MPSRMTDRMTGDKTGYSASVAIIGAGIGGLAAALRLAARGLDVTVFERHATPGGKMRTTQSQAGPVDAGPTVLTMKPVFDALFAEAGARLEDHVTLTQEPCLARHFWRDGTQLDLMADPQASRDNVAHVFGAKSAREFSTFSARAAKLFDAFEAPMMHAAAPTRMGLARTVLRRPSLIAAMAPHQSLSQMLAGQFSEPKLAQLFGRYATYVGGSPDASPAILSLICHAEAQGVWHVKGGMHRLARAIEALARTRGARFIYRADIAEITPVDGGFVLDGRRFDTVLFNGDPRALKEGFLGEAMQGAVPERATGPRSLSACVQSFAAEAKGCDLAAHNVFFSDGVNAEFPPLAKGRMPQDATIYLCAQDRFGGFTPKGPERFETIMNAPPSFDDTPETTKDIAQCQTATFQRLTQFGLTFTPEPQPDSLTMPQGFARMFPASNGALYGRSPHGMMAAFKRPTARTAIRGLYLVGGGAHPGAGVPMATLSARHAAEAIWTDLSSTSTSPRAATRGGMSTGSAMTGSAPSRSLGS